MTAAALLALGCGAGGATPRTDAGSRDRVVLRPVDTGPRLDRDRDGVCDDSEAVRRTDPLQADTDGDGLLDLFEARIGTNPLTGVDPPGAERLLLDERPGSLAVAEMFLDYRGEGGEVLSASIQDRVPSVDGLHASRVVDFAIEAVDASPAAFVRGMEEARFLGVVGRTRLHWRVQVRMPPEARFRPLGCRRAMSFAFVIKREGDEVLSVRPLVLDILPPDAPVVAPDGGSLWPDQNEEGLCLPEGPCL